jgi:hypothetical protein
MELTTTAPYLTVGALVFAGSSSVASNNTEAGRLQNRRVEIIIADQTAGSTG